MPFVRIRVLLAAFGAAALLTACPLTDIVEALGNNSSTSQAGSGGSSDSGGGNAGGDSGGSGGTGSGSSGSGGSSGGSGSSGSGSGGDTTAGGGSDPGSGGTGADPGSGGTGAVASVGSVDGFGSVVVNGVRYDDTSTTLSLEDTNALALGMVVRVTGSVSGNGTTGVAQTIEAGIEIMGQVSSVDTASAQFTVMGTRVRADSATVWPNVSGVAGLAAGDAVKVSGLWVDGVMQATRVEVVGAVSQQQVTGAISGLDPVARTFRLGELTVSFAASTLQGLNTSDLADGLLVRVRGSSPPVAGVFAPSHIKAWLTGGARTNGGNVHLRGTIYGFNSLADFRLLGIRIRADGNGVQFSAASSNLGNGTDIQVRGRWSDGVLVAQRVTILSGPGGTPVTYSLDGTVGGFSSLASFRVRGNRVDASGSGVAFVNGASGDLSNGTRVEVRGLQIVNDVLKASTVTFTVSP